MCNGKYDNVIFGITGTVSNKIYGGEKFHGSLVLSKFKGKFHSLLLTRTKTTFNILLALKMAVVKSVGKTFAVCRKSMKIAKVFFHIAFTIYSI